MEFRVLQYFLAIAREQSISGAAEYLHISQPTLSRQIKDMEVELGKQLFIRGNRKIELTNEGMLLRQRAEEIINLTKKTENEIMHADHAIAGDVYIGAGESAVLTYLAKAANALTSQHPQVHYHISSDDAIDIFDQLDKGLIDFGMIIGDVDKVKYDYIKLPANDTWGLLLRNDHPLAAKEYIDKEDVLDLPLLLSRQINDNHDISNWLTKPLEHYHMVSTYNLVYNASIMVEQGLGCALTLDHLINTTGNSILCFRPLYPRVETSVHVIWKKYQIFSKASEAFLQALKEVVSSK